MFVTVAPAAHAGSTEGQVAVDHLFARGAPSDAGQLVAGELGVGLRGSVSTDDRPTDWSLQWD
ncbi:MAG: hypothetical protein ABMA64_09230, partial [Myxococcota bacterium]